MINDNPIFHENEDLLNRGRFVLAASKQINAIKDKECYIIGVNGKWGSGKTSILNLIEKELSSSKYYHFTAQFNPWIYKSEELLLRDLFAIIIKGCRSQEKPTNKKKDIGRWLIKYAKYLAIIPSVEFMGAKMNLGLKDFFTNLGEDIKGQVETIEEIRDKINSILNQLAIPLIIFVDDIDRLENKEVHSIFKVLKLTANFNKIRYVVAYDEVHVSQAIAKNYGIGTIEDGRGFLEKIIQVPLRIPETNSDQRFLFTNKFIERWLLQANISLPVNQNEKFNILFRRLHSEFVLTPRDSKRLINTIEFSESSLKNEINLSDLILIESIRLFIPKLFNYIVSNRSLFLAFDSKLLDLDEIDFSRLFDEGVRTSAKEIFELNFKENGNEINTIYEKLIRFLFPQNSIFKRNQDEEESNDNLTNNQRIGQYQYFIKYLEFNIGPGEISDINFMQILESINSKKFENLNEIIVDLQLYNSESIYSKIIYNTPKLTEQGKSNIAKAFMTIPFFYQNKVSGLLFRNPVALYVANLLHNLESAILDIEYISLNHINHQFISYFLRHCLHGYENGDERNYLKIEPTTEVIEVIGKFIQKFYDPHLIFMDVDRMKLADLLSLIYEFGDFELLKTNINNYVNEDPMNVLKFMKSCLRMEYHSSLGPGIYGEQLQKEDFPNMEHIVDRKTITEKLNILYPSIDFENPGSNQSDINERITYQYLRYTQFNKIEELLDESNNDK
jgi:hypothetical protein